MMKGFEEISMEEAVKNGGYIITPIDMFTRVEDLKAAVGFVQVHAEDPEQAEPEQKKQEPTNPEAPMAKKQVRLPEAPCATEGGMDEQSLRC